MAPWSRGSGPSHEASIREWEAAQGRTRHELHPPPLRSHANDSRRSGDAWLVGEAARSPHAADNIAAAAALAGALKNAGGEVASYRTSSQPLRPRARSSRAELKPPSRELDVAKTVEALRGLRKDQGLFQNLTLDDIEDFAEACSPLSFARSQLLFSRGELAVWFGVLLSGQVVAYVPGGDNGDDLLLGTHGAGRLVGIARVSLWEKSHVRAYSLKVSEAGYVACITYDQLEHWKRSRPAFHLAITEALLVSLTDLAAGFFRGCPLSCGIKWPVVAFSERRVLDFLLKIRDEGKIFIGLDYRALLALACRLRLAQFAARSSILSRGQPLNAALLVLDGKLTAFRDPGAAPSAWYGPGDCVGLEAALGGRRPCPVDVFAARLTLVAVLLPEDLADLGREFPAFGAQVLQSLYSKFLSELADPHGRALLLLAEGATAVDFPPGAVPPLPPGLGRPAGGLEPLQLRSALKIAEETAPIPSNRGPAPSDYHGPGGLGPAMASALLSSHQRSAPAGVQPTEVQAGRDDALLRSLMMGPNLPGSQVSQDDGQLRALMLAAGPNGNAGLRGGSSGEDVAPSAWHLGSFFSEKIAAARVERAERVTEARAIARLGGADASGAEERASSAPPAVSRSQQSMLLEKVMAVGEAGSDRRRQGTDLSKSMRGLDVTATDFEPSHAVAPHTSGLRQALSTSRRAARSLEIDRRIGAGDGQIPQAPSQPWALKRARSAPPDGRRLPASQLERSYRGAAGMARLETDAGERAQVTCPNCGTGMELAGQRRRRPLSPPPSDGWKPVGAWAAGLRSSLPSSNNRRRPGMGGPAEGLATSADASAWVRSSPSAAHPQRHTQSSGRPSRRSDDIFGSQQGGLPSPETENEQWWYYRGIQEGIRLSAQFPHKTKHFMDLASENTGITMSVEEAVETDHHQAFQMKVMTQQHEIERLQAQLREMETEKVTANEDLANVLRERDDWKASCLRMQLNREFKNTIENLNVAGTRFLRPEQHGTSLPDFEESLRQQLELLNSSPADSFVHKDVDHRPPPALRTFPRYPSAYE